MDPNRIPAPPLPTQVRSNPPPYGYRTTSLQPRLSSSSSTRELPTHGLHQRTRPYHTLLRNSPLLSSPPPCLLLSPPHTRPIIRLPARRRRRRPPPPRGGRPIRSRHGGSAIHAFTALTSPPFPGHASRFFVPFSFNIGRTFRSPPTTLYLPLPLPT